MTVLSPIFILSSLKKLLDNKTIHKFIHPSTDLMCKWRQNITHVVTGPLSMCADLQFTMSITWISTVPVQIWLFCQVTHKIMNLQVDAYVGNCVAAQSTLQNHFRPSIVNFAFSEMTRRRLQKVSRELKEDKV